jgi:hypothetical protein
LACGDRPRGKNAVAQDAADGIEGGVASVIGAQLEEKSPERLPGFGLRGSGRGSQLIERGAQDILASPQDIEACGLSGPEPPLGVLAATPDAIASAAAPAAILMIASVATIILAVPPMALDAEQLRPEQPTDGRCCIEGLRREPSGIVPVREPPVEP